MEPGNFRFGGGVASTVLNPAVAVVIVFTAVLMCCLPRRRVIIPFLVTAILIPSDQVLVLAGLHFPLLRILLLFGIVRSFVIKGKGNWHVFIGGVNRIDRTLVLFSITTATAGMILFHDPQAVIYQLGELYTALCTYFLLRGLIRDRDDVVQALTVLALISVVLAGVMLFEQLKGWNPYSLLGGARAQYFAANLERDGKFRATASFGTPILAGTFGAVLLPLFIGLWLSEKNKRGIAILGLLGATAMTAASNSSTPVMAYMAGLLGLCLWPIRGWMRFIRWSIAVILLSLHIVMKAPVWHLITRIDISGSSYHRYALIDQSIRHVAEWWLIGTANNGSWGWDMWDTANQYVATAVSSGLLAVILFITVIVYGFKYLGKARHDALNRKQRLFCWALSSTLFAQTVAFFGISYWDQSVLEWYALLAFIGAVSVLRHSGTPVRQSIELHDIAAAGECTVACTEQRAEEPTPIFHSDLFQTRA